MVNYINIFESQRKRLFNFTYRYRNYYENFFYFHISFSPWWKLYVFQYYIVVSKFYFYPLHGPLHDPYLNKIT